MHRQSVGLLIGACLMLPACATATRGTHEALNITSEPIGATALTDMKAPKTQTFDDGTQSKFYGCAPTPCKIRLPRTSDPVVTLSKPGHQPIKFKVTSAIATSATSIPKGAIVAGLPPGSYVRFGNPEFLKRFSAGSAVIVGGLFTYGAGTVVDLATGANKNLTPNPVTAYLAPSPEEPQDD